MREIPGKNDCEWEYGERHMHPLFWWAFGVRVRMHKS